MPCLADVIDCLLCGTRTDCVQVHINDEAPPEKGQDKWSKNFCQLLSLKDDTLEDKLYDSFYCVTCSCKIKSISSISSLIENMKTKLSEIRTAIEDDLYLSNPHLFGGGDDDENTEPGEKNKNQNALRAEMISAVEAVKRSALEPKKCDAGVLTEPVIIIEENELNDLKKRAANGDAAENDSSDQNGIVDMDDSQGTPGQESKKQRQRQLIKIRINSDSVSEDIINTLRLQSGSGSSQTRQLIIRGYREIEVPQPVKSRSKASDAKSPICIDLDNEADISIAQNQNQTPVQQQLEQTAIVPDENLSPTPTPTSKRRGRPSAKDSASKTKTSSKSKKPRKSNAKSKSVQCPVCDVDCESTTDRRHHVEMAHKQGELFVCPHCGGAYATERKLFNHQKVHLKPEESEEEEEGEEEIGREADGESEMEGGGNEYFANENNGNEEYAEDDEEEDEDEDDYMDNDDDDEDWTDMEPAVKKTSRGRKSTVDKDTSRSTSKSNKSKSKSSQFVDESPENIEVELVHMNPEDHSDFLMDQYHSSSIPQPSQGRKSSNKRKSSQIPRAAEETLVMNSGANKRPKMATNSPVIKVASNKKVVGLPEIQQTLIHGSSQASGSENESNSSGASPRKSGRLRPKFRQYFY